MKTRILGLFGLIMVAFLATSCLNVQPCPPGTHTSLWSSSCESDQPKPQSSSGSPSKGGSERITLKIGKIFKELSGLQKVLLIPIGIMVGLLFLGFMSCGVVSSCGNEPFATLRGAGAAFAICFFALAVFGICFFIAK